MDVKLPLDRQPPVTQVPKVTIWIPATAWLSPLYPDISIWPHRCSLSTICHLVGAGCLAAPASPGRPAAERLGKPFAYPDLFCTAEIPSAVFSLPVLEAF